MNSDFLDLLVHPHNGSTFSFKKESNELISSSGESFPVEQGVPIIKFDQKRDFDQKTELHDNFKTSFDYQEHYEKDAETFDYFQAPESGATRHENHRLHQQIFSFIKRKNGVLLDVGCGNGWASKAGNKQGLMVISLDISVKNPIEALKNNPSENHAGLVADVYQLPIKDSSLDYIIASEIMEHVVSPQQFVEILFNKLKPGGKLIITTPYNEKIEYNLCVHCNCMTPRHAHLHSFSEHNISKLIPDTAKWSWIKFSNKYLEKLRLHFFLKFFPFRLWKLIDKVANAMSKNPNRLLIVLEKR